MLALSHTLSLIETPPPELTAGSIRIDVRACGVNRADLLQRRGLYPPPPGASPLLGLEVAGEVLETDRLARRFRAGEPVVALLAGGGYARQVVVDERLAMPLPAGLLFEQGAAIPEVFLTAHHNLFTLGGIGRKGVALVHAGASGVGTAAIQLLRRIDAGVFVTVGTPDKAEACVKLGARAILYRTESFPEIVGRETAGRGVDVILDPVGAKYLADNLASLALDGRLILIGLMGGKQASLDLSRLLTRRIGLLGSTLRALPTGRKAEITRAFEREFLADFERGKLQPVIDSVFPVSRAKEAHERMESNANIGKIVLSWESSGRLCRK